MNRNPSHEKDAIGHLMGVGLFAFLVIVMLGMFYFVVFAPAHCPIDTGLVPQGCPSGKVTIQIRMNGKLFQSFERNSLQAFDFKVPAAATVIITPEKVYY